MHFFILVPPVGVYLDPEHPPIEIDAPLDIVDVERDVRLQTDNSQWHPSTSLARSVGNFDPFGPSPE